MNEIVIKDQWEKDLTIDELTLFKAQMTPKLMDISPQEQTRGANMLVLETIHRMGLKNPTPEVLAVMINDLQNKMQTEFKGMRFDEVRIAISDGCFDSENFGISSRSIIKWIREWKNTKKLELQREIERKRKKAILIDAPKEMDDTQKMDAIQSNFHSFTKKQTMGVYIFPFIEQFGHVKTPSQKFEFIDKACEKLEHELKTTVFSSMMQPYKKQRLEDIKNSKDREKIPAPFVVIEAQRMIINDFFGGLVDMETTPKDYFQDMNQD